MSGIAQAIFSRSIGEGPRRVLALHCTLAHSGVWRGVVNAMGDGVSFVAPDMLSHGRSPDWDRQGDYQDRCVAAIAPLLEGPMDIIGHSFGGLIALRLAVQYPERVRSLTMIEPVFFSVAQQDAPAEVAAHDAEAGPFVAAMRAGDDALGARLFNRMWSEGGPPWDELPETTRTAMTRSIHVVEACRPAVFDDVAGLLQPGVLDRVTCPVLLLMGGRSQPIIKVVNDGLVRRLPNAMGRVVDGAGHMVPISHPDATAAEITALFAKAPI